MSGGADLPGEDGILPIRVDPASPTCPQSMVFSPTSHAWPTSTRSSIFAAARTSRFADSSPVDAGVSLNFHVVFKNHRRLLHDLVPTPVGAFRKSKPVAADHDAILKDHAIPDCAAFADNGLRMRQKIISDSSIAVNRYQAVQHGVARPISTPSLTKQCGPMCAPSPIFAVFATTAVGCIPGSNACAGWKIRIVRAKSR